MGAARAPRAARLPMDARIRARRAMVARQAGRRRLRAVLGIAGVLAALAAGFAVTRSPLLDVDRVEVVGAVRTGRPAVVAASGLGGGPPLVDVEAGEVARRVEALPWVADARVERRWPATVRIEVRERRPRAVVPAAGGRRWAVVDDTARVLAVVATRPPRLPALGGLAAPGPPGSTLGPGAVPALAVATALPPSLAARVADVAATPTGVELALAGPGPVARLGDPGRLAEKLAALEALLARLAAPAAPAAPAAAPAPADVAVIDVRVPSVPVLTRR